MTAALGTDQVSRRRRRSPLREAQRQQTLSVIHHAAMDLVLQSGVAAATTDRIADLAGVSVRTLFNYYVVKEDAILGLKAPTITPTSAQRFAATAGEQPLVARTVLLLADTLRSVNVTTVDLGQRRTLLQRHPELSTRLLARIAEAEDLVHQVLAEQPDHGLPGGVPVQVISRLAGAVIRYCLESRQFHDFPDDADLVDGLELFRAALGVDPSP